MANPVIKIKRSAVAGRIPTTTSLELGELAINTYDGKVFIQQDQGGVGVGSTVIAINPWSVGVGSIAYNTCFTAGSVGIGTTLPKAALNVVGVVSATSFVGDGSQLTGISAGGGSQWVTNSTGIHTLSSVGIGTTTATSRLTVSGDGIFTGVVTAATFLGNANLTNVNVSGVATIATGIVTSLRGTNLNYTGVSTFSNGPVFIGSGTTTGTILQPLQVTGGAYVSGSVGIGTTNPREKLDVTGGNISIQGISTSSRFYIQHNTSLNSLDFVFI